MGKVAHFTMLKAKCFNSFNTNAMLKKQLGLTEWKRLDAGVCCRDGATGRLNNRRQVLCPHLLSTFILPGPLSGDFSVSSGVLSSLLLFPWPFVVCLLLFHILFYFFCSFSFFFLPLFPVSSFLFPFLFFLFFCSPFPPLLICCGRLCLCCHGSVTLLFISQAYHHDSVGTADI